MSEVKFLTTVDETRTIRLPDDAPTGRVEVVVRDRFDVKTVTELMAEIRCVPQTADPTVWKRAREELRRSREEE